jgi:hypothetical protein
MRPFSTEQLRSLIRSYCAATGSTAHALGCQIFEDDKNPNHKVLGNLLAGRGCRLETAERASAWFVDNWPADLPWPAEVPAAHQGEAA